MNNINNLGSQPISGGIGIEVEISPNQRTAYFPDVSILRGKKIRHIDVCDSLTKSANGLNIYKENALLNFVARNSTTRIVENLPISQLTTSIRNGNRLSFNHDFDLSKSFITIPNNSLVEKKSIFFVFWYNEPIVSSPKNPRKTTQINNFEVELTNTRTYFLENRRVGGLKFQSFLLSYPAITAENKVGISESTSIKSFITLQKNNLQFIQKVPLYIFQQASKYYMLEFENIVFDFSNSFIDIVNPVAGDFKSVYFNCIVEA